MGTKRTMAHINLPLLLFLVCSTANACLRMQEGGPSWPGGCSFRNGCTTQVPEVPNCVSPAIVERKLQCVSPKRLYNAEMIVCADCADDTISCAEGSLIYGFGGGKSKQLPENPLLSCRMQEGGPWPAECPFRNGCTAQVPEDPNCVSPAIMGGNLQCVGLKKLYRAEMLLCANCLDDTISCVDGSLFHAFGGSQQIRLPRNPLLSCR